MSRRLTKATESLRQAHNFAAGVLIGSAGVTPVFAATEITADDLTIPLLVGSLVMLVLGLALKARRARSAPAAPSARPPGRPQAFREGIGQYRLQLGRSDAD